MAKAISSPFMVPGGLGVCIPPLLDAIGWRGSDVHLSEAMPHLSEEIDLSDLLNVMANLKFGSRSIDVTLNSLDRRSLPCLFIDEQGKGMVLAKSDGNKLLVFDGEKENYQQLVPDSRPGTAFFLIRLMSGGIRCIGSRGNGSGRCWIDSAEQCAMVCLFHFYSVY